MLHNRLLLVDEFTTPSPLMVRAEQPLIEAAEIMETHGFRHLPVVDEERRPVGILSDRDIKVVASFEQMQALKVKDLMSPDPYTVSADTPLEEVVMEMSRNKIGSALVQYPEDDTYGLFTSTDALNALVEIVRGEVRPSGGSHSRSERFYGQ